MFGSNWHDIRPINSYEEAKAKYYSTAPLAGPRRAENIRPIGKRSKTHARIVEAGGGSFYGAQLYETVCVEWHNDGSILIDVGGWNTLTTAAFVDAVLPVGVQAQLVRRSIWVNGYVVPSGGLWLRKGEAGTWQPVNPVPVYVHKINRAKSSEVRRRYADFLTWVKGYINLREGRISTTELEPYRHRPNATGDTLSFIASTGEDRYEDYVQAALIIAHTRGGMAYIGGQSYRILRIEAIDEFILYAHAEEVLEEVQLEPGDTRKDRYAHWL